MRRGKDLLRVGAALGACAVCCPPLVLVPLGLVGGLGAGATATTAVLGAPAWLVAVLFVLLAVLLTELARRRTRRGAHLPGAITARGPQMLAPRATSADAPSDAAAADRT